MLWGRVGLIHLSAMIERKLDTLEERYPTESIRNLNTEDRDALDDLVRHAEVYLDDTLKSLNALRHAVAEDDVSTVCQLVDSLNKGSKLIQARPMQDLAVALDGRARDARSTWGFDESVDDLWTEFNKLAASITTVKDALKVASSSPSLPRS